jgi:hypothetical protein
MSAVPPDPSWFQRLIVWFSTDRPRKVAVIVTVVLSVAFFAIAVPLFSRYLAQDRIN